MQTLFLRPIENHHLHWFNMTQSCKHDSIPQCIWKPCRHHSYRRPMCTWGILVIFGGHLGFGIKMSPLPTNKNRNIILTPEAQYNFHKFVPRLFFPLVLYKTCQILMTRRKPLKTNDDNKRWRTFEISFSWRIFPVILIKPLLKCITVRSLI